MPEKKKFHWTSPDGVEITLPRMGDLPTGILRRHRKEEPADFAFSVLEELDDDDMLAKIDALPIGQMEDLSNKWMAEAGATPGE